MEEVCHVGAQAISRLTQLGLSTEVIHQALETAAADARTCTALDAPGAPASLFWSRSNRYLREQLIPEDWKFSNRLTILRTIHPSGTFAITAMSASKGVGDPDASVRAKNPKGAAIAELVELNQQLGLFSLEDLGITISEETERNVDDLPTWFILYRMDETGIAVEVSLPVKMHGKYVDTWAERIMVDTIPFGDGGAEFNINTDDNDDQGPEFDVTYKGI
ncbi:hypothetical protein [Nonomuraea sp. NPDC049400]|uniref:hypothetical protein n=1 Tax=Nonomuraea sp. NPDC049400 TaxID=3364352 RepID=UPI0037B4A895